MNTIFEDWKEQYWNTCTTQQQRIAALCVLVAMTPQFIKIANYFVAAVISQPELADTLVTALKTRLFVYYGEIKGGYYQVKDNIITEGPATDITTFLASDMEEAETIASLYDI